MASDLCPYCGTLLTTSLKFCVNCRRSVTEDKIKMAGARRSDDEEGEVDPSKKFRLARKTSYDGIRQARTVFTTITSLLMISFVYYFVMKFVIHEPIPFEEQLSSFVGGIQKSTGQAPPVGSQGAQGDGTPPTTPQ